MILRTAPGLVVVLLLGAVRAQQPAPTVAETLVLALDEVVALALQNNLALRSSVIDEEIERAKIREALGAYDPAFFSDLTPGRLQVLSPANFPLDPADPNSPTVTRILSQKATVTRGDFGVRGVLETGMSYSLTFRTDYSYREEQSGLNPIFNNSTTLAFTQPLLRGAWTAYGQAPAELARLSTLSAHQAYQGTVRDKVREVQGAYFDLVFALEDLEMKRQSLKLAEQQVQLTGVRVQSGALPRVETTAAESGRAGRRVEVVTAEAAVVAAEDRLRRQILAFDRPTDWEVHLVPAEKAEERYVELREIDQIVALAEKTEPDLLRAHLAAAQAEIVLDQRRSERLPKFDLNGNLELVGLSDRSFEAFRRSFNDQEGAYSYTVGLAFEVPIGNRSAAARVAQSELALKKARIDLQETRTELVFRIRSALRNIDVARRSIAARKEATRLAAEQLENERLKLDLKTSTNFQVFQVEDQMNRRRTEEIRAILDYRLSLLDLSQVSGVPLSELVVTR